MVFKKDKKFYDISFVIIFFMGIILLIIFSFKTLDLGVGRWFGKSMNYEVFQWYAELNDSFGVQLPVYLAFLYLAILLEAYFSYLNKRKDLGKKRMFMHKNEGKFMWSFYGLILTIWVVYIFYWEYDAFTKDMGFGKGNDFSYLGGMYIRITTQAFSGVIGVAIIILTMIYFRKYASKNNMLINENVWERTIRIAFFQLFSFLFMYILKRIFGRSALVNVDYQQLHDYAVNVLGWTDTQASNADAWKWPITDYQYWWEINHFSENWTLWFKPLNHKSISDYGYSNVWFPSGHINAFMCFFASSYILTSFQKSKKGRKINIAAKVTGLVSCVSVFITLLMKRGHYVSDIAFTMIATPIFWYLTNLMVDKKIILWINNFNSSFKENKITIEIINIKNYIIIYQYSLGRKYVLLKTNSDKKSSKVIDLLKVKNIVVLKTRG